MKKTKIAAIVACAALLVLGMAFTSLAANKWAFIDGYWYVVDSKGEVVAEEGWCKGQDGIKYWADDDGAWVVEDWVYDGDDTYYVGEDGKKATGWQYLADPDENSDTYGDYFYYYFVPATGKLYLPATDQKAAKLIEGNYYCFDSDTGKMLSGWCYLDGNDFKAFDIDEAIAGEFGDIFTTSAGVVYYCGAPTEGWAYKGWNKIMANTIASTDIGDTTAYWFYMNEANGKVKTGDGETTQTITGGKYVLDDAGRMLTGFVKDDEVATPSSYLNDDGSALTKEWIWAVPTKAVLDNDTDLEEDVPHWFFGTKKGVLATGCFTTAKTTSTYWALDNNGIMLSGLYDIPVATYTAANPVKAVNRNAVPFYTLAEDTKPVQNFATGSNYFYFGEEETDGSMKTGEQTVTINGDDYKMRFRKKSEKYYVVDTASYSTANKSTASCAKIDPLNVVGAAVDGFNGNKFYIDGQAVCGNEDNGLTVAGIAALSSSYCVPSIETTTCELGAVSYKSVLTPGTGDKANIYQGNKPALCVVKADGTIVKKASGIKDAEGNKYYVSNYMLYKVVEAN